MKTNPKDTLTIFAGAAAGVALVIVLLALTTWAARSCSRAEGQASSLHVEGQTVTLHSIGTMNLFTRVAYSAGLTLGTCTGVSLTFTPTTCKCVSRTTNCGSYSATWYFPPDECQMSVTTSSSGTVLPETNFSCEFTGEGTVALLSSGSPRVLGAKINGANVVLDPVTVGGAAQATGTVTPTTRPTVVAPANTIAPTLRPTIASIATPTSQVSLCDAALATASRECVQR